MRQKTLDLRLPAELDQLIVQLQDLISRSNQQINLVTEGAGAAFHGARTSVPTTGTWASGDFVKKSTYVEAGAVLSKYVITGWLRLTNGSGNVLNTDWVEGRVLTGN